MSKALFIGAIVLTVAVFLGFVATFSQSTAASASAGQNDFVVKPGADFQEISIKATSAGVYENPYIAVKKGVPVKLNFSADSASGCGRQLLVTAFNVSLLSRNGETVSATFLPEKEGKYEFSCSMRMFRGTLEVVP